MWIKTITCHDVYNHGATLQAYALMRYLQKQGHEAEIIDYKPDYLSGRYRLWLLGARWKDRNILVRLLYLIWKFPGRLWASKAKIPFDRFKKQHMRTTPQRYRSNVELKQNPPLADAYMAGSDQIWNTLYDNGRDPAFYLDFAPEGSRRIAYAASFATPEILPEYWSFVKAMLARFDSISVRETSGVRILESLGIDRGVHVLDPVFLLGRNEWDQMAKGAFEDKYLLVYDFERNPLIERLVEKIAAENRWKIYAVNNYGRTPYADRDFYECGPETFLGLIQKAELVVSNSFHATAFSVIFGKPFYVFDRMAHNVNSRMRDLLAVYGLEDRLVQEEKDIDTENLLLDFGAVHPKLAECVAASKQYLELALGGF